MANEQGIETEEIKEQVHPDLSSILQEAAFGDNPIVDKKVEEKKIEEKKEDDDEILEPKDWLKGEFDTDDVNVLKAEREELKSAKEKLKKFEIDENGFKVLDYLKPENEDKLYEYLDNKKKISKLSTADVSDKNIAAELVKYGIKKDNPTLKDDEVDFLFNERFSIPEKPVQGDLEEDDDFKAKVSNWEKQKETIEKRLVIEAKINQPRIAELNTKLTLPNIEREIQGKKEPTQEELAAFNTAKDSFLQSVQNVNKDFSGFTANVKNKDVDYNVAYTPSQEERNVIQDRLKTFAESNFDANSIFFDRWVSKDKSLNIQQMTEDLSRIFMGKNSDAKIANEAANKRMELYLQEKKQIDIKQTNEEGKLTLDKGNETVEDKLRERMLQLT